MQSKKYVKNDELNNFIAVEVAQMIARIMDKVNQTYVHESSTNEESYLETNRKLVLDLYFDGASNENIAEMIGVENKSVVDAIHRWLPFDLIYKKYNSGMLPSRIGRLSNVKLTTNQVRHILNMPPVKGGKNV